MNDLIKGAMIGAVLAVAGTAVLNLLAGPAGGRERGGDRAVAAPDPRCAPAPIKMPCLQPEARKTP